MLAFATLLVLGGKLGDVYGRKRALLVGLIVFTSASVVGGLAPDDHWLIAAASSKERVPR